MSHTWTPTGLLCFGFLFFFNLSSIYTSYSAQSTSQPMNLVKKSSENVPDFDKAFRSDDVVVQYASRCGFEVERHYVETGDGYILTVHRLKSDKYNVTYGPVLVIHGFLCSSVVWVWNKCNESLGFLLAQAGFDVWLGNTRGTGFSLRNKNISTYDKRFWNFSMEESGLYDLPSMLKHILNVTGRDKLAMIGHSMGGTEMMIMLSMKPEYNKNVSVCLLLSAAVNFTISMSPLYGVTFLAKLLPDGPLLFQRKYFNNFLAFGCASYPFKYICVAAFQLIFGKEDPIHFDQSRVDVYFANFPAVSSIKCVKHMIQIRESNTFQRYDYGVLGNKIEYGQITPPAYYLENVKVPVAMISAEKDTLCSSTGQEYFSRLLPNLDSFRQAPKASHMDFAISINPEAMYYKNHSICTLQKYSSSDNRNCP